MSGYDFVLASASPRRRELLAATGYRFVVEAGDFDEDSLGRDLGASEFARRAALGKAMSVACRRRGDLVLGADTIAECDGEIIGKPRDAADARRITEKLFGGAHRVITALALVRLSAGVEIVRHDVTIIYPRAMSREEIEAHIAGGSWQGKAGAYAVQETGEEFVERMEGSFTNVVGLPMELLAEMLREAGGGY